MYGGTEDIVLQFLFKLTSLKWRKRGKEGGRERLGRCGGERGRRKEWSQGECAGWSYVNLTYELESSERRDPQLRKCLHKIWL